MSTEQASAPDAALGRALIEQARDAINELLGLPRPIRPTEHAALNAPGASFVTLTIDGQLRGCIGQLEATRELRRDVRANAVAAASRDPRFPPLTAQEWARVEVEVSVLSPMHFVPCPDPATALSLIEPGRDGVVLASAGHRATFLPQVWRQLPQPQEFLLHLLHKAGLREWPADMQLGRYRVDEFHETQAVVPPSKQIQA